jgi:predicted MPP superfamily phosphohydrolase
MMLSRRQLLRATAALGTLGAATSGYGLAVEPLETPRITRYALTPARWPDGLNLNIAVLADLHACEPWMTVERIASIADATNALGADLIVLLGDYVASHRFVSGRVASRAWAQALSGLKAPLGVHAVLGNHDWWQDKAVQRSGKGVPFARRALEAVGIPVYENDAVRIPAPGGQEGAFWLAGLGDQFAFGPSRRMHHRIGVDDLDLTLTKVTDDAPVILLAHEPDIVVRVPARVSLQLSGHTHGGQIRVFGWSPMILSSPFANAYGHIRAACDLIVSGGLGCSIVPVRLGMPPEIVLVSLGAGKRRVGGAALRRHEATADARPA